MNYYTKFIYNTKNVLCLSLHLRPRQQFPSGGLGRRLGTLSALVIPYHMTGVSKFLLCGNLCGHIRFSETEFQRS